MQNALGSTFCELNLSETMIVATDTQNIGKVQNIYSAALTGVSVYPGKLDEVLKGAEAILWSAEISTEYESLQ